MQSRRPTHHLSLVSTSVLIFSTARLARMVFAGLPHHVTQRGNRREAIFCGDGDQEIYRDLLEQTRKAGVDVWAYRLMPNHVHLILTPKLADGLGLAVGEAHRRYTNLVKVRGRWTGNLFQSRLASPEMVMSPSETRGYCSVSELRDHSRCGSSRASRKIALECDKYKAF